MEIGATKINSKPIGIIARVILSVLTILAVYSFVYALLLVNRNRIVIFDGWSDYRRKVFLYPDFPKTMGYVANSELGVAQKKVGNYCLVDVGTLQYEGDFGYAQFDHERGGGISLFANKLICNELFGGRFDDSIALFQSRSYHLPLVFSILNGFYTPAMGYYSSVILSYFIFLFMSRLAAKRNDIYFSALAKTGKQTLLAVAIIVALISVVLNFLSNMIKVL